MATRVVGKLDWEDGDTGGSGDFMNLVEGSNVVRILSDPYQFYVAWCIDATGQNRKVRSAMENCPLVERGEKIQPRWYVAVLDRKTGRPAILELSRQVFQQVLNLKKKEKWGDPRKYDLDIERHPKGSQPLYTTSPEPREPLSDSEKAAVREFLGKIDIAKMVEPPSREEVLEKLGVTEAATKVASESVSNDFGGSDDDFDFGD